MSMCYFGGENTQTISIKKIRIKACVSLCQLYKVEKGSRMFLTWARVGHPIYFVTKNVPELLNREYDSLPT